MKEIIIKNKQLIICNAKILILAILAIIITFPKINLSYSYGIDPPLSWIFNYLFANNIEIGKNILFPHEPLAFFMYPLQENFILALSVKIILQLTLVFGLFNLVKPKTNNEWIIPILFSFILLKILTFNLLIFANISISYLLFYDSKLKFIKYYAFFLTVFAIYVKAYIGILAGIVTFFFLLLELIKHRQIIQLLKDSLIIISGILLFWIIMYYSLSGLITYFVGMKELASDNSAAAAYFPENNWILLSVFLIIVFTIPFLQKTKRGFYFGILFIGTLFASWKHGMAREDIFHALNLFNFLVLLFTIFILFIKKNKLTNIILITIALLFFYINLSNVLNYKSIYKEYIGVNNFVELITDYKTIKEKAKNTTKEEIKRNILPTEITEMIGNNTVDIYPWDYSIIPANNLNWQPRPVIHSYATYTSWLDQKNADHFQSDKAPEYIILHLRRTKNLYGETILGLDNRYFFNDEPNTILQILSYYELEYKYNSFIILKKRDANFNIQSKKLVTTSIKWNEWVEVPENNSDLIRVNTYISKKLLGKIKSFFYKDELYYIYYKLEDGIIHKHRIVPKNAVDGIWINPFIIDPSNNYLENEVKAILFKCSNTSLLKDDIKITFENFSFINNETTINNNFINNFFKKTIQNNDTTIISSILTFEKLDKHWATIDKNNLSNDAYIGRNSYILKPNSFLNNLKLSLDTITSKNIVISANCWVKSEKNVQNIVLVISTENSNNNIWFGEKIENQIIDNNEWNNIHNRIEYKIPNNSKGKINVYLWNNSEKEILIDDFAITVKYKT